MDHYYETFAELMGLYQSFKLMKLYPGINIKIMLDNLGVVNAFEKQMNLNNTKINKIIKSDVYPLWEAIRKLYKSRNGETTVQWIKGHSGNVGNEFADLLSNKYGNKRDQNTLIFRNPNLKDFETISHTLSSHDSLVELGTRRFIKEQNKTITAFQLSESATVGINNSIHPENDSLFDWKATVSIWHHGIKITSPFTSRKLSAKRNHQFKVLTSI